jgi:ABC-type branched-subunit amino acid transport system substrate-binding protein
MFRGVALAAAAALTMSACSSDDGGEQDAAAAEIPCTPDGVLKIGNNLPQTGDLAFLGPPEFAGTALAVQEINDAGGVLGEPVEIFDGDSGDTTSNIAVTTAEEQLQRGVDVVVGAASSAVSKTIIDKITTAGVLQISPANTSTEFIDWPDQGLYFRTAPPDQFQGAVLAELATNDGVTNVAVMARQDSYGESLANTFERNFTSAGGSMALDQVIYDPAADAFETEVGQVKTAAPDGIILIGFKESIKIVQEMIKQGIGPDTVKLFLVDGNLSNSLFEDLPTGAMTGTKGTLPGAEAPDEFRSKLLEIDPDLVDFSYGPEAYDAVNLVALAAVAAESDCGRDIAAKMQEVSSGGEQCTTFGECSELLANGTDIDYQGQSGPVEFGDNGDPTEAVMGVYVYGDDNQYGPSEYIPGEVPALPSE